MSSVEGERGRLTAFLVVRKVQEDKVGRESSEKGDDNIVEK